MKLSDLVKIKVELDRYANTDNVESSLQALRSDLLTVSVFDGEFKVLVRDLASDLVKQNTAIKRLVKTSVEHINELLDAKINELTAKYFEKGYENVGMGAEEDRKTRVLPVPSDIREKILAQMSLYTDWHYPGLEIGPHDGEFTGALVSCDPLYLADVNHEYLDSAIAQFPVEYQVRVRKYHIGYQRYEKGLIDLPREQFGFVFSWNFFNYLPFDEFKKYLIDVFSVLRPGGAFMFSYNNGETVNGARHVEWGGMSYTPKKLLISLVESFGFEVVSSFVAETTWHNISWLIIKKPGELQTIRAHQTLGLVKDIK